MKTFKDGLWVGFWIGVCFSSVAVMLGCMIAEYINLFPK